MTTAREIRELLQPILDRENDVVLVGRFLFLTPISGFVRYVFLDRTVSGEDDHAMVGVAPAFLHPPRINPVEFRTGLGVGESGKVRRAYFQAVDERHRRLLRHFITNNDLPFLRTLRTFENHVDLIEHGRPVRLANQPTRAQSMVMAALGGDFERARTLNDEIAARRRSAMEEQDREIPIEYPAAKQARKDLFAQENAVHRAWFDGAAEFIERGAADELVDYCHAACRASCELAGIAKHYVRTPFPVEAMPWYPGPPPGFAPRVPTERAKHGPGDVTGRISRRREDREHRALALSRADTSLRAILAPFLKRHGDLTLTLRNLVVGPARHVVRFVHFDFTAGKGRVRPTTAVEWLAKGPPRSKISGWSRSPAMAWGELGPVLDIVADDFSVRLEEAVGRTALPRLRSIETIEDAHLFVEGVSRRVFRLALEPTTRLSIAIATGDIAAAKAAIADFEKGWQPGPLTPAEDRAPHDWTRALADRVLADDIAGAVAMMHASVRANVAARKLEKVFVPTPLPVEMQLWGGFADPARARTDAAEGDRGRD